MTQEHTTGFYMLEMARLKRLIATSVAEHQKFYDANVKNVAEIQELRKNPAQDFAAHIFGYADIDPDSGETIELRQEILAMKSDYDLAHTEMMTSPAYQNIRLSELRFLQRQRKTISNLIKKIARTRE